MYEIIDKENIDTKGIKTLTIVNKRHNTMYYLLDKKHALIPKYDTTIGIVDNINVLTEYIDYYNKIKYKIKKDELIKLNFFDDEYTYEDYMDELNSKYNKMNAHLESIKNEDFYKNQQKSSKTTNESSYDLINDILTIFENSF